MEETINPIELAMRKYKELHGDNSTLEDGEEFATVFNDGIMIISFEDKCFKVHILYGPPFIVNQNIINNN